MHSRAFRFGCGAWWPSSRAIASSRSTRFSTTVGRSLRVAKRGCAINIGIGVNYVRAYPSALIAAESEDLFEAAEDNWRIEGWLAQLGWMGSLGHEGGLFVTVGQRR
jgi:hypothetical protein